MATVNELREKRREIKEKIRALDAEHAGEEFPEDKRVEWNDLNEEEVRIDKVIEELKARAERLASLDDDNKESERDNVYAGKRVSVRKSRVPDDPTDISAYRNLPFDQMTQALRDGAMEIVEDMQPAHPGVKREEAQDTVGRMLDTIDSSESRDLARRVIVTSSRTYERAFGKYLSGSGLTPEEQRALSMASADGGYAVPVTLDPTVILTSNGVVNPIRQLARIEQITGNKWNGVSSAGITASYEGEAVEVGDDSPTLGQPTADVEKAQAFVPFSIEIGQDWGSLQSEMARMFADAKDTLEADKFLKGLGHSQKQPEGLLVGATGTVLSAATAAFAVGDLYALEAALAPRWRARAAIVANKAAYQKVRQFDTGGGASLWVQLQFGEPANLIGYAAHEWSDYSSLVTTSSASIMTIGDFNQFLIVDRVGMNVEVVPHLFATANNRPTGQRGLYAYWRNTSDVLVPGAFKTLKLL